MCSVKRNKMNNFVMDPLIDVGTRARYLRVGLSYGMIWLITWYSARLLGQIGGASLWFLPGGLRFAAIFLLGWPGVLLELVTVWVVSAVDFLGSGKTFPLWWSAQMAWLNFQWLAPVAGYALVLLPLRAWLQTSWNFKRPLHSTLFLAAALAAAALAALGGSFGLLRVGAINAAQVTPVWAAWLVGDYVGIVTLAPLLLVQVGPRLIRFLRSRPVQSSGHVWEGGAGFVLPTVVISVVSLLVVYTAPKALGLVADMPFFLLLLLLPLVGLALRFGLPSALLAVVLLDSGLVVLIAFAGQSVDALRYQLVMIAIALVGLWLGGAVEARVRVVQRYRDFAYVSNDLLWETDASGRVTAVTGRLAKHMERPIGRHWREVFANGDTAQLAALERNWQRQRPFRHLDIAVQMSDHPQRWFQINGQPLWNNVGELVGYRGTVQDVSKARRARTLLRSFNLQLQDQVTLRMRELQASQRHLQVVLAAAPVGVIELDAQGRCCFINDLASALTGCSANAVQDCSLLDFVHPDDQRQVEEVWRAHWLDEGVQQLQFRLARTKRWCALSWIHLNQADAASRGSVLVLTDATAQRQHEAALWSLAHHDTLTNLPNRSLFKDRCAQALNLAKRNQTGAAVLWVDLDGFKAVNDMLGHAAGDQLLVQVAQRLTSRARDTDTVARMGGDEFALVMSGIGDVMQADKLAAEIVASLAQPFDLKEGRGQVTASVGVALYPQDAQTVDDLIRCADLAMYSAKRGGKNKEQSWASSGLAPLD